MKLSAHSSETLSLAKLAQETHARNAAAGRSDEFPTGASVWPADLSRRHFLQLMGASLALAGVGGCNRPPSKEIVPYTLPPEAGQGAEALYYASAFSWEGFARGILVAAHTGRPTKIEGNPQHPDSLGATDAITQAAVLSLYDPDRSKTPRRAGEPSSWQTFDQDWRERRERLSANRGRGFAILSEPTTSPTYLRELHQLLDTFPEARWYQHTPLVRYDRNGVQTDYDFAKADVVFTIDADVFSTHPSAIRYSRAFTARRKVVDGKVNPSRLYTVESSPSITGSMADVRLPADPARWPIILNALAEKLAQNSSDSSAFESALTPHEEHFINALARDLSAKAPNVLCVVDAALPESFHAFADSLHAKLGAVNVTVRAHPALRSDRDARAIGNIEQLTAALDRDEISELLIIDSNPVYTAGGDQHFAERLRRVPFSVHLGQHFDETAEACRWHLPQSHFLEAWGDLRAFDGTASIVQPLIEPLYETASACELLRRIWQPPGANGYELVRETWRAARPTEDFENVWRRWLDRGVIPNSAETENLSSTETVSRTFSKIPEDAGSPQKEITIIFKPDPNIADGRWSNNAWLQELPKPFTHLVWDNALLVSQGLASLYNLENGDEIQLAAENGQVTAPIWIVPGHADNCVTVHLGYGRRLVGTVGVGHGFDAYKIRSQPTSWLGRARTFAKTGGRQTLVSTHSHFSMEGRDLAKTINVAELSDFKREKSDFPSLYPKVAYTSYAWGLSIDLSVCTGCNACVIACQAENNIPVVGKDQVARGREMHWIRIDRYYSGDPANPRILQQPVPCMHCENAPCELVCPVAATVHSSEGLNDMVYNRCVGTRYCSNNCPYKVRRFNFFDYREPAGSPEYLQKNPNVTSRERGVMEKCTYCVQRINAGRIRAERENRKVRDGEIVTACQQACPVEAIVFGDINDPASRVSARKREKTDYSLLAELNTRPRTTYLTRIINVEGDVMAGGSI